MAAREKHTRTRARATPVPVGVGGRVQSLGRLSSSSSRALESENRRPARQEGSEAPPRKGEGGERGVRRGVSPRSAGRREGRQARRAGTVRDAVHSRTDKGTLNGPAQGEAARGIFFVAANQTATRAHKICRRLTGSITNCGTHPPHPQGPRVVLLCARRAPKRQRQLEVGNQKAKGGERVGARA